MPFSAWLMVSSSDWWSDFLLREIHRPEALESFLVDPLQLRLPLSPYDPSAFNVGRKFRKSGPMVGKHAQRNAVGSSAPLVQKAESTHDQVMSRRSRCIKVVIRIIVVIVLLKEIYSELSKNLRKGQTAATYKNPKAKIPDTHNCCFLGI